MRSSSSPSQNLPKAECGLQGSVWSGCYYLGEGPTSLLLANVLGSRHAHLLDHPHLGPNSVSLHLLFSLPVTLFLNICSTPTPLYHPDRSSLTVPCNVTHPIFTLCPLCFPRCLQKAFTFVVFTVAWKIVYTFVYVSLICLFLLECKLYRNSNCFAFFSFLCFVAHAQNKAWNMGNPAQIIVGWMSEWTITLYHSTVFLIIRLTAYCVWSGRIEAFAASVAEYSGATSAPERCKPKEVWVFSFLFVFTLKHLRMQGRDYGKVLDGTANFSWITFLFK